MFRRSWLARILLVTASAAMAVLIAGGTASATVTLPLHSSHKGVVASQFASGDCAKDGEVPPAGSDRWVFVLPRNDAHFVSLTLTFKTPDGTTVTVKIPDASDPYPDAITTNGTSKAWVILPSGWTLLDGSAEVSGPTSATFFNLTHTCLGAVSSPSPSTSPSPSSSASPSPSESPSASTSVSASGSSSGNPSGSGSAPGGGGASESSGSPAPGFSPASGLAKTGTAMGALVLTGVVAALMGAALVWFRRRRDAVEFTSE
jgi:LPXTG-motif cell wall-anchored protein